MMQENHQSYLGLEKSLDKVDKTLYKVLEQFNKYPFLLVDFFVRKTESTLNQFYDRIHKHTAIGKLMRHLGLPYSLLIPKIYKRLFFNEGQAMLFSPGVHMVSASVGGGKSLLSFILAEINLDKTGLATYFTSPVEKPQLTKDGKFKYVYHRYINLDNYYDKDGKKVKRFNTEKHKMIMKDERHLEFNPRLNNTAEYKKKFIPQQRDEILMRHEGITHIYKFSQYKKLDSQDMQALTYMHEVKTVKDIPIRDWLETGDFNYRPVMLKVNTFIINVEFDGSMKRKKVGSCRLAVSAEVLERFDTYAERYQIEGLPVDYK